MKSVFFLVLLVLFITHSAFAKKVNAAFNHHDQKVILDYLNDACADAWCEGPVQISFKSVVFDVRTNSYIIFAKTIKEQGEDTSPEPISFNCVVKEASIIDQLKSSIDDQFTPESSKAREKLFTVISTCIDEKVLSKLIF